MSKRTTTSCIKRKGGTARCTSAAPADVSESKRSASVLLAVRSAATLFSFIAPMDAAVAVRRADQRDRRLPGIDCRCEAVATALKDREILLILPILPLPNPPCVAFPRRPQRLLSVARSTHATGRLVVPSGRAYGATTPVRLRGFAARPPVRGGE